MQNTTSAPTLAPRTRYASKIWINPGGSIDCPNRHGGYRSPQQSETHTRDMLVVALPQPVRWRSATGRIGIRT